MIVPGFVPEVTALMMDGAFSSSKNPIHPIAPQALNSGKCEFLVQNPLKRIPVRIWWQRRIRNQLRINWVL
jgi:hypothetical protein